MPTLVGRLPDPGTAPEAPCSWCGAPTDIRLQPYEGSRVGPVPLHMLCGATFIRAFERLRAGLTLTPGDAERVQRFMAAVPQLEAGHDPAASTALDTTRRASTSRWGSEPKLKSRTPTIS